MKTFIGIPVFVLIALLVSFSVNANDIASPKELRDKFMVFHSKGNYEAAKSLFCAGDTAQRIVDMYNRTLESAFNLTIQSALVQEIPEDSQPSVEHVATPEKRLYLSFSKDAQQNSTIASSFFYIAKSNKGYCLSIPKI